MMMLVQTEVSEEDDLILSATNGDRGAFGELYVRYARMVHGILLSRVPRTEVDDLLQDFFLLAMRRLPSLREAGAFGSWLAMIARNRATDFHRSSQVLMELREDALTQPALRPEALAILETIQRLPEAYRETLVLRLVEGMTGPEIAERTGLTPQSVRVNLHRGMKQLRENL